MIDRSMKRGITRRVLPSAAGLLLCFFFAASLLMAGISTTFGIRDSRTDSYSQEGWARSNSVRRRLIGPGSYPPRCTGKCGRCTPCRPVHVTVPPGAHAVAEYYPEAWRCKCGNRLYLPTTRD